MTDFSKTQSPKSLKSDLTIDPRYYDLGTFAPEMRTSIPGSKPLGKFDAGWRPELSQEYTRGFNQPWYSKFRRGIVRSGLSIPVKVAQMAGHVAGALDATVTGLAGGGYHWEKIWDNIMAESFHNMDKELKESFPIHHQRAYAEGNLARRMWTAEFWASDLADGAAFLASAYVPGGVFGAAGKALSLTGKAGKYGHLALTTVYNTVGEAGAEALEIRNQMAKEYERQGLSPEQAKEKASIAAQRTFAANAIGLIVPNALQSIWFFGAPGTSARGLRRAFRDGKLKVKDINVVKEMAKGAATGFASEGLWEENFQTSIQQYEARLARGEAMDDGIIESYVSNLLNNAWGFTKFVASAVGLADAPKAFTNQDQGATAIFLGGLLGGPLSMRGGW